MKEYTRTDRLADQIQRELATLIQREIKDPRLSSLTTLSGAKVSKDLGYADIYVTVLGAEDNLASKELHLEILQKASGYLRNRLGQNLRLRVLPQLRFHYDDSVERGSYLSSLIDKALAEDKQRAE